MTNNKKFDAFIAQYNGIKNEAVALKTLKDYMFSLSNEDMFAFMDYTQTTLFEHYQGRLNNPECTEQERHEIAQQLSSIENILIPETFPKAA